MPLHYYYLDENKNVVAFQPTEKDPSCVLQWAYMFEDATKRFMANTDVGEEINVSTIFDGLDHDILSYGKKPEGEYEPLVFETMVFRKLEVPREVAGNTITRQGCEQYGWRNYADAMAGHERIVEKLRETGGAPLGDFDPLPPRIRHRGRH